jgi:uncharacterized YigZ family protein
LEPGARYRIPAQDWTAEEEILKSRFIAHLAHAPDVESARAFIARIKGLYPDATHHCWAYRVGPPGSTALIGLSDDGEPHGTAGRPMLNVILHSEVGDLAAVVVRYYGGTKLGTGGLTRAYSGAVALALQTLPTLEKVQRVRLTLVVDYGVVTLLRRLLSGFDHLLDAEEFGADVTLRLRLPYSELERFRTAIDDLTHGQALLELDGPA